MIKFSEIKKVLYSKMMCTAKTVDGTREVCGFLELDDYVGKCHMSVMMDSNYDFTLDIEDMHSTIEYVEVIPESIKSKEK